MKIRPYRSFGTLSCLVILSALLMWGSSATSAAENAAEPINITADKLVADNVAHTAEFSGNVHAVQGDTEITANRLKLFYDAKAGSQTTSESGNIVRIEAYSQVRISFDNKVAVSDEAIYITSERKLILQGPGSKVISGQNEIAGSKITFHRNDGRVILDGSADNRVKAIIHPGQRGLN